jgi:hypothetical protein
VGTNVEVGRASNVSMGTSVGVKTAERGVPGTGVVRGAMRESFGKLHADVKITMKTIQCDFIHSSFSFRILTRLLAYRNSPSDVFFFGPCRCHENQLSMEFDSFTFSVVEFADTLPTSFQLVPVSDACFQPIIYRVTFEMGS